VTPQAEAQGAVRRFGSRTAVDAVDLRVSTGEIVGLLGANGAGKTTLIRLILGLLRLDAGEVRLFDSAPSMAARRGVGYVPQGLGLYEDLTVAENVAFAARAFGVATPGLDADLAIVADRPIRDLALGIRRRTAFAAALAHDPRLLILDEPTSGVDALGRAELWDTIRRAAEAGAGALVTTHYMDETQQCDRLVVMANGRVVASGTIAQVIGGAKAVRVDTERWQDAFSVLDDAGMPIALIGRSIRVPAGDPIEVHAALSTAGIAARTDVVPASLEEAFVLLTSSPRGA
jgi:ABC-type multidrug transport system ATPase subunit